LVKIHLTITCAFSDDFVTQTSMPLPPTNYPHTWLIVSFSAILVNTKGTTALTWNLDASLSLDTLILMRHVSLIFQLKTRLLPQKIRSRHPLLPRISLGSQVFRGILCQRPRLPRWPTRMRHPTPPDLHDPPRIRHWPTSTRHPCSFVVPTTPRMLPPR
jgi:hypothetical protein